jgi:hypothetical protein
MTCDRLLEIRRPCEVNCLVKGSGLLYPESRSIERKPPLREDLKVRDDRLSEDNTSAGFRKTDHEAEWDQSEKRSTRIALGIALLPIPISLVVAWSLNLSHARDRVPPASEVGAPTVPKPAAHGAMGHDRP